MAPWKTVVEIDCHILLGASICGIGSLRTDLFPKWSSGIFTIASGLAFLLLATANMAKAQ